MTILTNNAGSMPRRYRTVGKPLRPKSKHGAGYFVKGTIKLMNKNRGLLEKAAFTNRVERKELQDLWLRKYCQYDPKFMYFDITLDL